MPSADPEKVKKEVEDIIGLDASDAILASAKEGIGIDQLLEKIVTTIPAPTGEMCIRDRKRIIQISNYIENDKYVFLKWQVDF